MIFGKWMYNLYHIAWHEKVYLPLGVAMIIRIRISCKKTFFFCKILVLLLLFERINCSEALIFAHAKTSITFQIYRRDNVDVNSFCCILRAFS